MRYVIEKKGRPWHTRKPVRRIRWGEEEYYIKRETNRCVKPLLRPFHAGLPLHTPLWSLKMCLRASMYTPSLWALTLWQIGGSPSYTNPIHLWAIQHGGTHAALLWKAATMSFYVSVKVFIDYNAMQTLREIKGEMFEGEGQFVYG